MTSCFASRRAPRTAAFTLVELAVVLVIVGLIIGGVLTAQQITQNARITSATQGIKSVQAAAQSYNQNYGALPGDDIAAVTRFANKKVLGKGNHDGTLDTGNANDESLFFWSHLRAAGLVKGDPEMSAPLSNPFGGNYTVQNGAFTDVFVGTNVVCLDHVPGSAAQAIDQQLDDGQAGKGNIVGGVTVNGTAATGYDSGSSYVLCTPLL
ncbi:MAG: prepilin-type N-terminal cleavage/methylation domain-containing protein [Alphaproteobacteria bacterium]